MGIDALRLNAGDGVCVARQTVNLRLCPHVPRLWRTEREKWKAACELGTQRVQHLASEASSHSETNAMQRDDAHTVKKRECEKRLPQHKEKDMKRFRVVGRLYTGIALRLDEACTWHCRDGGRL